MTRLEQGVVARKMSVDSGRPLGKGRIPKLTYRTQSADAISFKTTDAGFNTTSRPGSSAATSTSTQSICRDDAPGDVSERITRRASDLSSDLTEEKGFKKKGRKSGFFAALFTAREPSAHALAEYQKQLEQTSRSRGGSKETKMPGVSAAKLPSTVPKVNSRWDGLPTSMQTEGRPYSSSVSTRESGPQRPKSRDTLGGKSTSSGSSQNRMVNMYGWESDQGSNVQLNQDGASDLPRRMMRKQTDSPRSFTTKLSASSSPSFLRAEIPDLPPLQRSPSAVRSNSPALSQSPSQTLCGSQPNTPEGLSSKSPLECSMESKKLDMSLGLPTSDGTDTCHPMTSVTVISTGSHILGPPVSSWKNGGLHSQVVEPRDRLGGKNHGEMAGA